MLSALAAAAGAVVVVAPHPAAAATIPSQRFVRGIYCDFLFRDPTSQELSAWPAWLEQPGVSRGALTSSLVKSSEFSHTVVAKTFRQYFDRGPDVGGDAYWSAYVQRGGSIEDLEVNITASDEYYQNAGRNNSGRYVDAIYRAILDRNPEPSGRSFWSNRLNAGGNRSDVAAAIVRSMEASVLRVQDQFDYLLGRAPDPGGQAYWATLLTRGVPRTALAASIASSDEYFQVVQTLTVCV